MYLWLYPKRQIHQGQIVIVLPLFRFEISMQMTGGKEKTWSWKGQGVIELITLWRSFCGKVKGNLIIKQIYWGFSFI